MDAALGLRRTPGRVCLVTGRRAYWSIAHTGLIPGSPPQAQRSVHPFAYNAQDTLPLSALASEINVDKVIQEPGRVCLVTGRRAYWSIAHTGLIHSVNIRDS
jgi:hypothetical protein